MERVPEEEHDVVYTRMVGTDKRIAPENVTCFEDIWMEDDIMTSGRKIMTGSHQEQTHFIAHKAQHAKELKLTVFKTKNVSFSHQSTTPVSMVTQEWKLSKP